MTRTLTGCMTYVDPQNLAATIAPENFELFLRAYLAKQCARLKKNPSAVMLFISTGYGTDIELKKTQWTIDTSERSTKGEIFSQCIDEYNRRLDFEQSCTLRLIEATPESESAIEV